MSTRARVRREVCRSDPGGAKGVALDRAKFRRGSAKHAQEACRCKPGKNSLPGSSPLLSLILDRISTPFNQPFSKQQHQPQLIDAQLR
ncbi:hypothetical protein ES703_124035 [subsurface metagenome]